MPFSAFVADALYGPEGLFERGGGAGRGRDFITSPELGDVFGTLVAAALAAWDVDVVVEAGAGRGALARVVTGALPDVRYVAVERSATLRRELAAAVPAVEVLDDLPGAITGRCAVVANELLDNIPCDLALTDGREVLVVGGRFEPGLPADGGVLAVQRDAHAWVERAAGLGRVVAFDYCTTTASMASRPWTQWLRTYRGGGRGGHPLERPGSQDITCEVAVDQLPAPSSDTSQAEFLEVHGLGALREANRAVWEAGAARPDLTALRARSRLAEAAALTDPDGLGAFRALEWNA